MKLEVLYGDSKGAISYEQLIRSGTVYIGREESDFIRGLIDFARKYEGRLFLHDIHGRYRGLAPLYLDVGIDLKIDLFSESELMFLALKASLDFFDIRQPYWHMLLLNTIYGFRESDEKTLDAFLRFLIYRANESSGVEKMGYTILYNIFNSIFPSKLVNIFSYDEYTSLENVKTPVFIGYGLIDNLITKVFIQLYTSLYLIRKFRNAVHIILYADPITQIKAGILNNLMSNRDILLHSTVFSSSITGIVRYLLIEREFIDRSLLNRYSVPSEFLGCEYLLFDRNILLEVIPPHIDLGEPVERKVVDVEDDYLTRYIDVVTDILEVVNRFGEVSLDGIYINLGSYEMPLIASLVDRLWREGYLRRIPSRGGVRYRLSIKGLRFLRGGLDE